MARFLKDRKKNQGAAPGSLIFIGKQRIEQSSIRMLRYNPEKVTEKPSLSIEEAHRSLSAEQLSWITICGLHDTELIAQTGKLFEISPLILEDILNTDQRPRFSEETDHLYVIIKAIYFGKEDHTVHMEQISLIAGDRYLIAIQESDTDFFKDVRKRILDGKSKIRTFGTDYLCYAMLDTLVDNYIINIEYLGNAIEEQEKRLLLSNQNIKIEDIYHYKTELSYIRKNVRPVKELTTRFANCDSPLVNKKTYSYLHDLDDLVVQAQEAIEIYYTMVSDQLNIFQTNINNRINDVMKVLTIFSALFIPLTFIVGIYGMNFDYMPELRKPYAYPILWGIMIFITILMLIYFKRKKWF